MKRQSNIELLRCLSMFMVLLLHSSFLAFGMPDSEVVQSNPWLWGGRIAQQGIGIVAVDVFVLISGWFSIRPKKESICCFLFQIAFLQVLSYVVFVSVGLVEFNKESIKNLMMLKPSQGWFIKAYLLLYIISPVLNVFVENTSKRNLRNVLIAYWGFLISLGWVFDVTDYINNGYSIVSFVGLYLLARYMKVWNPKWAGKDKMKDITVYILCCVGFFGVIFFGGLLGLSKTSYLAWKLCSYVSPFTVIGAISLLLFFSKLKMNYNTFVNLCGKGCFAVYLLHGLWGYWFDTLKYINTNYSGIIYILSLLSFILIVYFGCIFVDLLRIRVWTMVEQLIKHKLVKVKIG